MMEQEGVEYYTIAEAAARLEVSPSTVRRWIRAGALHGQYVGPGTLCVRRDDVERREHTDQQFAHKATGAGHPVTNTTASNNRAVRPLSPEEAAVLLDVLNDLEKLHAEMLARRGGVPFADSSDDIATDREEQSKRWR